MSPDPDHLQLHPNDGEIAEGIHAYVRAEENWRQGKVNYFLIGVGIIIVFMAFAAHGKVHALEKKLKEKGILEEDWDKDKK